MKKAILVLLTLMMVLSIAPYQPDVSAQAGFSLSENIAGSQNVSKLSDRMSNEILFMSSGKNDISRNKVQVNPQLSGNSFYSDYILAVAEELEPVFAIENISLSPDNIVLKVGGSSVIQANIQPFFKSDLNLIWESSDPLIACVDENGLVKALRKGTVTITCTVNGNSEVKGSCTVKVNPGSMLSYLYDKSGFFYVEDDPWQRNFGFNRLYDAAAAKVVMYYHTVRVKFAYNNLDWMIQLWKGQYGYVFIGSEIGVYTKSPALNIEHYACASDDNSLNMGMSLYRKNKTLFSTDYRKRWWATGFVPGTLFNAKTTKFDKQTDLLMKARITLKDEQMTNAFIPAFENCGFVKVDSSDLSVPDTFYVSGNDIYLLWRYIGQPVVIKFNANGGIGGTSKNMVCGEKITAPYVTREGYFLTGWSPALPAAAPSVNTTYTAQWKMNQVTVSFDANGGSSVPAVTQDNRSIFSKPEDPVKTGSTFAGWYSDQALTQAVSWPYASGTNDVVFYAKWLLNTYNVVFDANGGSGGVDLTCNYGDPLTAPDVVREGYTFDGWEPEVPATVGDSNVTFTAKWIINNYSVTFDANGGDGFASPVIQAYNTEIALPPDGFEKTGYVFLGWGLLPDSTAALIVYNVPAGDSTLYAIYQIIELPPEEIETMD